MRLRGGIVARKNHPLRPGIIHLAVLRGFGQIDDHRAGTTGTGDVVRFGEHARNVLGVRDQIGVLGDRVGDTDDIGFLERIGADGAHAHLAGDDHHWDGIHVGVSDSGDHVGGAGAGGDDAYADLAGGHSVAFGRMACSLLVAGEHETELGVLVDGIVDRQDGSARNAEHVLDAQILQRTDQRLCAGHLFTVDDGLFLRCGCLRHAAECLKWRWCSHDPSHMCVGMLRYGSAPGGAQPGEASMPPTPLVAVRQAECSYWFYRNRLWRDNRRTDHMMVAIPCDECYPRFVPFSSGSCVEPD